MATLDSLPTEIILHIAQFLTPLAIVKLQLVCRRLLELGRDDALWREQSFLESSFLEHTRYRREILAQPTQGEDTQIRDLARALADGNGLGESKQVKSRKEPLGLKALSNEKVRIRANWDPVYPGEQVNWYDEYITRHAPISTSWLQQPRNRESAEREHLEVRGVALYTPPGDSESSFAVAPLDDGSLCLWDISGTRGRRGAIWQRSKPGILSVDLHPQTGPSRRSKMVSTGVTECISIDSFQNRAYVAVQSSLVEIDLETLSTTRLDNFPFSITALSEAKYPTPLTVGTNLSLHLHDTRSRGSAGTSSSCSERLDSINTKGPSRWVPGSQIYPGIRRPEPNPVSTHLYQPGPLSILHLPLFGDELSGGGEIYVAGRFPSILNYERRTFPKLRGTIHSGARLCSMTSLPYPFSSLEKDLARQGDLSMDQISEAKSRPGKTLIACGEYNSKGSLELYGLSPYPERKPFSTGTTTGGTLQNSAPKNRQTSSSSKLLSISNHGTQIVVSDGGGNLKWMERDGFTEARRWNTANHSVGAPRGIFGTLADSYMDSGSGDIVIKILENKGELILWTGEKIGLLSFSNKPGLTADSFEQAAKSAEEARLDREERIYSKTMRRALEHQANEVRYVKGLGLGL